MRLRKTVAFDRLLSRMVRNGPDTWVLKRGFALQLLIEDRARTTKDIDVLLTQVGHDAHELLVTAALADLDDWFEFAVAAPTDLPGQAAIRMTVQSRVDGRQFESFHIDVGVGDPVVELPDRRGSQFAPLVFSLVVAKRCRAPTANRSLSRRRVSSRGICAASLPRVPDLPPYSRAIALRHRGFGHKTKPAGALWRKPAGDHTEELYPEALSDCQA